MSDAIEQLIGEWRSGIISAQEAMISIANAAVRNQAQQPGAQAVGYIDEGDDGSGMFAEFYPDRDLRVGAKLYLQPPSIPEPSDADVDVAAAAYDDMYDGNNHYYSLQSALSADRARLRERIGQAPGGDGDA